MSGKMVGKSMVFYFKYGRQLDQYLDLNEKDRERVIKMGAPDLSDEQVDEKLEMIKDVTAKANRQAKEFFNELAREAENILKQFCNTDINKMEKTNSEWDSLVYISQKSHKKTKSPSVAVGFIYEEQGPEAEKSGHPQLEIYICTEGEEQNDERLFQVIEKIYNGKLSTICYWPDWNKDNKSIISILRVPVYHTGIQDFQVEKEQLFKAILEPLKMLKQKDVDKILDVMP